MGKRAIWEIKGLDITLKRAGISIVELSRATSIDLVHLEQIRANHGQCWCKHTVIRKIEEYFSKQHELSINKKKRPFGW
jgi:hypothetical protein